MPHKSYSERYSEQVPEPTRFEALAGPWRARLHDEHSHLYEVAGALAGEQHWEGFDQDNEPHTRLRAEAIEHLPTILGQLVETYDLLLDVSDRDETCESERTGEDAEPGLTGERLRALMHGIGRTLSDLEDLGERLGLDSFAIIARSLDESKPAATVRFSDHREAHAYAGALSRCAATDTEGGGPEFVVVPARLVDAPTYGWGGSNAPR